MRLRILAAVAAIGVLLGAPALTANASPAPDRLTASSSTVLAQGSVTGYHVKDGSLYCTDLAAGMCAWLSAGPFNNTVRTDTIINGQVKAPDLDPALLSKVNTPDLDKFTKTFPATTIVHIGGPYSVNHTEVGKATLPAGRWNLIVDVVTNRTAPGDSDDPLVRPQTQVLGLNSPAPIVTIMGNDISKTVGRELMGNATGYYESDGSADNLTVNVFGYDDKSGSTDSGILNSAVKITAYRIG